MDSLGQMLSILDMLSPNDPVVDAPDIERALSVSRATSYRYLRALTTAGLLVQVSGGGYTYGARIIELDRAIRLSDPISTVGAQPMRKLSERLDANMFLTVYYHDAVMTVEKSWLRETQDSSWDRGRPMPLFHGAAGKVVLAYLPVHRLRALMLRNGAEIKAAGLGDDWKSFRTELATIRHRGYHLTRAEVDDVSAGIAAPIFDGEGGPVVASLVFAILLKDFDRFGAEHYAIPLMETAQEITHALGERAAEDRDATLLAAQPKRSREIHIKENEND